MSQTPSTPQPSYTLPSSHPEKSALKAVVIVGSLVVAALIGANIYLYNQVDGLKQQLARVQTSVTAELGQVRETGNQSSAAAQKKLDDLQLRLVEANKTASQAAGQAKVDASKRVAALQREVAKQQQELQGQIAKVEETTTSKIGEVSTDVSNVRTEVASNKTELDNTIAQLKSTQGDLGVQSGLIATNGKELAALKARNDRNYFEFSIGKTKTPQRVGDVFLVLKKTDAKRNRFTFEVTADDKRTEKKDKSLNEPIQFYTSKARQPYEVVVNDVKQDHISGYLATPKVLTTAR